MNIWDNSTNKSGIILDHGQILTTKLGASTRKVVHVPKVVQQERQHHFHVEETVDVPIEQHVEQVVHVPVVSRGERIVHNPVDLEVEMGWSAGNPGVDVEKPTNSSAV